MDKKELKMYVTPAQEIIENELEGVLCSSFVKPVIEGNEEDELDIDE